MDENPKQEPEQELKKDPVSLDIDLAQRIIHILHALDVRIPTDIDMHTAIPAITRSVRGAVQSRNPRDQNSGTDAKTPFYYSVPKLSNEHNIEIPPWCKFNI